MSKPFSTNQLRLPAVVGDPGGVAGQMQIYAKLDAGIVQVFAQASDGTVYQLTPPSAGGGSIRDLWGARATPHPADDEFIGPALDSSWLQTGFSNSLNFGVRPNPYVIPGVGVSAAAFESRINPNQSDPSWLRIQSQSQAGVWKPLNSAAFGGVVPANLFVWARFVFGWRNANGIVSGDGDIGLSLFEESGGGFSFARHATMGLSDSQDGTSTTIHPIFWGRDGGTVTRVSEGTQQNNAVTNESDYSFYSGYVGIQKIDDLYYGWILDDGGRLSMGLYNGPGAGINAVAVWVRNADSGTPGVMLGDIDFIRFYEGSNWIP